jgi:hypothetical protein
MFSEFTFDGAEAGLCKLQVGACFTLHIQRIIKFEFNVTFAIVFYIVEQDCATAVGFSDVLLFSFRQVRIFFFDNATCPLDRLLQHIH